MRILITEKLSKNRYKTPEGYLVCTDAILARTGPQEYMKKELWHNSDDEGLVEVLRLHDDVFKDEALASFENKPVTNEHPEVDVNAANHREYAVGFVRDVYRSKFEGQDVMMGNLVITDKDIIDEMLDGQHGYLSCGYDCDIVEENGKYYQKNIRGNHVALTENPRASITKVQDSVKDAEPTLVDKSGKPIKKGDVVTSFRGEKEYVIGWEAPRRQGQSGKVYTSKKNNAKLYEAMGYYVGVFDLHWENLPWGKDSMNDAAEDRYYYGKEAAAKYGTKIRSALKGKTVSKRISKSKEPGGLEYEAKKLGIDMWDLLEALEGLCYQGHCREIDDSTYKIIDSIKDGALTQTKSYEVFDKVDAEIAQFCKEHNIKYVFNGRTTTFSGAESDLKRLHKKFFYDYEFELTTDSIVKDSQKVYTLRKGVASNHFRQYLRDRRIYFETAGDSDVVHFIVNNPDADVDKEYNATKLHERDSFDDSKVHDNLTDVIKYSKRHAKKDSINDNIRNVDSKLKDVRDIIYELDDMMDYYGYGKRQFQKYLKDVLANKFSVEHFKKFDITKEEVIAYAKAVKALDSTNDANVIAIDKFKNVVIYYNLSKDEFIATVGMKTVTGYTIQEVKQQLNNIVKDSVEVEDLIDVAKYARTAIEIIKKVR